MKIYGRTLQLYIVRFWQMIIKGITGEEIKGPLKNYEMLVGEEGSRFFVKIYGFALEKP